MKLDNALKIWAQAQDYPRSGQQWGRWPEERTAEAVLRAREAQADGWTRDRPLSDQEQAAKTTANLEGQKALFSALDAKSLKVAAAKAALESATKAWKADRSNKRLFAIMKAAERAEHAAIWSGV